MKNDGYGKKQSLYAARSVEIKRATKLEKILF